jgi:hypothetical protein
MLRISAFEIHGNYVQDSPSGHIDLYAGDLNYGSNETANGSEIITAHLEKGAALAGIYRFMQADMPEGMPLADAIRTMHTPNNLVALMRPGESHKLQCVDEDGDLLKLVFEFIVGHTSIDEEGQP